MCVLYVYGAENRQERMRGGWGVPGRCFKWAVIRCDTVAKLQCSERAIDSSVGVLYCRKFLNKHVHIVT